MKVIHVVDSLNKDAGGPSRSVPQTCQYLADLGLTIELVTKPDDNNVEVKTSSSFHVRLVSFGSLLFYGLKLKKSEVSCIHLQHIWNPYIHIMAWIARLKGIPYIVTPRGMLEPWIMNRNKWKKRLAMFLYQRKDLKKAAAIHATCEMEKDNVRKLGFTNTMHVIPNGIDLSRVPEPKSDYRTKKVVFLSRIHVKKGIELLLDAWKKLENNQWVLEIAGEGEEAYVNSLKEKIKYENINNVNFVGSQYGTAKWDFLKSANVFILPTYSENFGIVVAESLAVGVPVITTKGTPWEELKTENCGWWIDLSVDNIISVLQEVFTIKPKQLQKMGENGKALIKIKYDITQVAKNVKNMYLEFWC